MELRIITLDDLSLGEHFKSSHQTKPFWATLIKCKRS